MRWITVYNRPLYTFIVAAGATIAMAMDHQPLIWTVAACIGGFILGWLTAPRKKDA